MLPVLSLSLTDTDTHTHTHTHTHNTFSTLQDKLPPLSREDSSAPSSTSFLFCGQDDKKNGGVPGIHIQQLEQGPSNTM